MQQLDLPVTAAADEAVVNLLAKDAFWKPHQAPWIAAYKAYQTACGSPFVITAHVFAPGVGKRQSELYDSRKTSGELKRMRQKTGLKSCPVCGSPVTGSLDHYLPRAQFREFSIMRANLIPSCMHCNSSSKGTTVHGGSPRRFIHPYYDTWADDDLWFVEVSRPYEAAKFTPRPTAGLPAPRDQIVAFHIENVLGTQFLLSMDTHWSSLPGQVKIRGSDLTTAGVTAHLEQDLLVARHASGDNSWPAALLRGILGDANAIEHIRVKAIAALMPPMPRVP